MNKAFFALPILFLSVFAFLFVPKTAHATELRGYFTSVDEINHSKQLIQSGDQKSKERLDALLTFIGEPTNWPYGTIGGNITAPTSGTCASPQDSVGPSFLKYNEGARLAYGKILAYHYTGNEAFAVSAREKILDLTDTTSFGGELYNGANQCVLELAFSLPIWIQTANLLESSPVWSEGDTSQFQEWLSKEVYHKVAWASRSRSNNWGAAGSTSAVMLADYVTGYNKQLVEVKPAAKTLSAAQAYQEHVQQAKDRATGVFKGDSQCTIWGVQSYGGIPDELRRGVAGCDATGMTASDNSAVYQMTHTDFLMLMAEFLWHRGDTSFYDLKAADGKGSLKQAIYFVINNPQNSSAITWEGYRLGHLFLPRRYYKDQIISVLAETVDEDSEGTFMPFAHLTHADQNYSPKTNLPNNAQCVGDINNDHQINLSDYSILVRNFLKQPLIDAKADVNNDGRVDLIDYSLLVKNFLKSCTTTTGAPTLIPSPTSTTPSTVTPPSTTLRYPPETKMTELTMPVSNRPGYLSPITDPVFNSKVTRVSDQTAFNTTDKFLRNIYSKNQAWNADGSKIFLGYTSTGYVLDGSTYSLLRKVTLNSVQDSVWSNVDPNAIYKSNGNKLVKVDVTTDAQTTVRTFTEFDQISLGLGEGNASNDGRYWPIVGKLSTGFTVMVYDMTTDTIVKSKSLGNSSTVDWVGMSQSGEYVLVNWFADGTTQGTGIDVYDRNLNFLRHIYRYSGHGDICYDSAGKETWVTVDYDSNPDNELIVSVPLDGSAQKTVMINEWTVSHISCRNLNRPGWAYISDDTNDGWVGAGSNEVYALKLDGSETVQRFAHTHSSDAIRQYDYDAMAVPNRDGTKIMWGSDWGMGTSAPVYGYVVEY